MQIRHKQQNQENFPVASRLFDKKYRDIITAYYNFARACDDIADNPAQTPEQKLKQLNEIEDIFTGTKKYSGKKFAFASTLKNIFISENLSSSLATDLLKAFRRDAEGTEYQTWGQLADYCKYSAAPVGRFMLALHNENPSAYLPSNSLCTALQIVNHIQDIKYDANLLKRVYIPAEWLKEFGVSPADLSAGKTSPQLRKLIKKMLEKVNGLLKDAAVLPSIVNSFRLRTNICIILSLTNIMIKKIEDGDVLNKEIKLSKPDWCRAVISGIICSIFTRHRTVTTKGL